jgi:hypothetical protein
VIEISERLVRIARLLPRADDRAARRFAAMMDRRTWPDPRAPETLRYVEAERLVDRLQSPEAILGRRQA